MISRNSDKIPRKSLRKITDLRRFQQHSEKISKKLPKFCKFSQITLPRTLPLCLLSKMCSGASKQKIEAKRLDNPSRLASSLAPASDSRCTESSSKLQNTRKWGVSAILKMASTRHLHLDTSTLDTPTVDSPTLSTLK